MNDAEGMLLSGGGRYFYAVGMLELVSSEQPSLLAPLIDSLITCNLTGEVCGQWNTSPKDLLTVARKAAHHLDRLERRRTGWRHPGQVVGDPNCNALASFANARRGRVVGVARARRLHVVFRKCQRHADIETERVRLEAFLRAPSTPVDVNAFMGWTDK